MYLGDSASAKRLEDRVAGVGGVWLIPAWGTQKD